MMKKKKQRIIHKAPDPVAKSLPKHGFHISKNKKAIARKKECRNANY